jgi:hypothetical protein
MGDRSENGVFDVRVSLIASAVLTGLALGCSSDPDPANQGNTGGLAGPVTGTADGTVAGATNGNTIGGADVTTTTGTTGQPTTGTGTTASPTTNTTTDGSAANNSTGAGGAGATTTVATATTDGMAMGDCAITVDSYEISEAIATVGIVTWSATGTIDSANIVFGRAGSGLNMTAPVDLDEPDYRTLLLGMKEQTEYSFQVVASSGGATCTSDTFSLTTGPVPNSVPSPTKNVMNAAAVAPGFIVTVSYANNSQAFIFDGDGDVVWYASAPGNSSGVRIDWENKYLWTVTGNPMQGGQGAIRRVSMDGTEVTQTVPGTNNAHHDLAPLPGGSVAAILHGTGQGACSRIVEISSDLSITDIVADVSTIYQPVMDCHPNAILYHESDNSFTISDRNPNMFVKISRQGQVQWQLGGNNPKGPHIQASWNVNHGHHLLSDGRFIFFNNNGPNPGGGNASPVVEFQLDTTAMTATEVFRYSPASGENSFSLGDVQRLPNGNALVTYSNGGVIHEVNPMGQVVQTINAGTPLGYAMHRESLYGPPPK